MKKLHANIANNLKNIRQNEKNWHQNAMADFLGMSKKYYNQIENGKANLTLDKIEDIATKLEQDVIDITGTSDTKQVFNNISQQGGDSKMGNFQGADNEVINCLLAQNQMLITQNKELIQIVLNQK